ncbi:T9SS type A sorting domain-containing protein [Ekhidna sp. MALMAid0563]|uniref:LamG-like jellyroll fold domain-containing protein n=1 Tax=Ekhidna sp. MALMAid0563 TaxID=3143937 RepID=UPI0032DE57A0
MKRIQINYSACKTILISFLIFIKLVGFGQTVIYSDDFESGFEGWSSANWTRDADAALGAADGNYLHPNSFNSYSNNTNVTTTSGAIDLTGHYSLILQVDISYDTEADFDGFNIEYSSNNGTNWNLLGTTADGSNWYNDASNDGLGTEGWSGDNGGWVTASIPLPEVLENNNQVRFRVNFASDFLFTDVGVGFDNFTITGYQTSNTSPGNVSGGLSLWLRANGPIYTENGNIAIWADESGNGNHARQTTDASRPGFLTDAINENPSLQYDDSYVQGTAGFYTREFFVVIDPDFISSSSAETGDVIGYEPGDVGSLELGASTVQFADELITHTIQPSTGYRSAFQDASGEYVLANPIIINDRWNATNNGQNIYLNGEQVDNIEVDPDTDYTDFADGAYILGYGFDLSDDFQGGIAEVVSYSSKLSASNRADVETYLAIKYGITLDEDPSSATTNYDYQVNGVTIIWPGTSDADYQTYHHDVAGIGRNVASQGLNQPSSQSINDATIVNMQSPSDLDDGEYMVWGNDDSPNTFTTSDVITGITQRLERIWKVKETGDVGTVTLNFDITNLSVDKDNTTLNLIVAPETATMPTDLGDDAIATLILGGTVSTVGGKDILSFENVSLSDGDFFTIGGDVQTISPGGVSAGLTLWLRPDDGVSTTASDLVTSWADVSGNGNDADQGDDNEKPTLLENEINFNDAIDFSDDFLDGIAGFNTHDYFLVLKPDATVQAGSGNGFVLGLQNGSFDGLYLGATAGDTLIGHAVDTYRSAYVDAAATISDPVFVLNARNDSDTPTAQDILVNDVAVDNGDGGTFANRSNSYFRLGNNFNSTDSYDGKIAEVISYNSRLSDSDRRDVVSYLALKYGVTLDIATDPYTVEGVSIYNNTAYSNDIAGIGINLDHGLTQISSMSGNSDAIVNVVGGASLSTGDYIMWGSDATDKTLVQSTELPAGYDERLQTEWQVDVTGSPGNVTVKVYAGNIDSYADRAKAEGLYTLLVNTSNDFSTTTAEYEGGYFSGDTIVFENVSFSDDDFFTVSVPAAITGAIGKSSGTVLLQADAGVTTSGGDVSLWTNQVTGAGLSGVEDLDGNPPALSSVNGYNFIEFDGTEYLESNGTIASSSLFNATDNTTIGVFRPDAGTLLTFWQTAGTNRYGTGMLGNNAVLAFINSTTNRATGSSDLVSSGDYYIVSYQSSSGTNNIYVNGGASDGTSTAGSLTAGNAQFAVGAAQNGNSAIDADVSEIGLWNEALSANDRRDVESYFALKYGIDLDISAIGYTYNGGTNLYNLTSYSNNIRGIGTNSDQGLILSTSGSINGSDVASMGGASSLNNGDYLVFGDDNGLLTSTTSNLPPTVTERVTRIWGVNETGDVGTVTLTFDLTGGGYGAYSLTNFSLILDSDADFTNGTSSIVSAASFDGTTLVFEDVDLSGAVNFSIGTGRDLATDTDSDGIPDYFEIAYGTDETNGNDPVLNGGNDDNVDGTTPNNGINDTGINGDGISDALEQILIDNGATGPISRITDTDGDGIPDWLEVADGTNPFNGDQPTASGDSDSDGDGIPDAFETYIANVGGAADPDLSTDTDGDGIPDYYEVLNNTDPNDVNDPTASGGTDSDADGISDALEAILIAGGASAPINLVSDMDGDGIPDYIEAQTNSDPFNEDSPGLPSTVVNIRSLQADYQVTGGNCIDLNGYQWVHVTDNNGSLVFSINPVGNNLGSTCWAVRILNGEANVRMQTVDGVQDEYVMNRNWWIAPTTQPLTDVYLRFYSLDAEPIDLRDAVVADGYDPNTLNEFQADSIHFTKISGIDELDPFVSGGTRTSHQPMVADAGSLGKSFTFGISSFSSFIPHYSPGNNDVALPVELNYFKGKMRNGSVVLEWQTLTEQNNEKFYVMRSSSGDSFEVIGELAGAGDSSSPIDYSFTDASPTDRMNYYQLIQVDYNGESSQSSIISINAEDIFDDLVIYPNPASELITIRVSDAEQLLNGFRLTLHDISGKAYRVDSFVLGNQIRIPVSHLAAGRYTLKMELPGQSRSFSIVKD